MPGEQISPHEVAEQIVFALKHRDPARFNLLLATPAELDELGFGKQRAERVAATDQGGDGRLREVGRRAKNRHAAKPIRRFRQRAAGDDPGRHGRIDEGRDRCATTRPRSCRRDGKHEQVYLGTLVAVGDTWKLIDVPVVGSDNKRPAPFFMAPDAPAERGARSIQMRRPRKCRS